MTGRKRISLAMTLALACLCGSSPAQQSAPVETQEYAVIAAKSIFLKDRRPAKDSGSIHVPPPLPAEENFVLRGMVFEDDVFHAYVEPLDGGKMMELSLGDRVAEGEVTEIQMDGIRYRKDGAKESIWVGPGRNLAGTVSSPGRNLAGSVSNRRESRR